MTNLLKVLVLAGLMLCGTLQAQQKDLVYIENFSYSSNIGDSNVANLRNQILAALVATSRFNVKDSNSEGSLKVLTNKQTEDASTADESTLSAYRNLNANYIIQGHVTTLKGVQKKDSEGKISYDGHITFSLKVIDISDGTLLGSKNFNYEGRPLTCFKGSTSTPEEAIEASISCNLEKDIKLIIEEYFPLSGDIIELGALDKKGELKEVYIGLGEQDGLQKKQNFKVYIHREVAGRKSKKEVGEIEVTAVEGADISLCKVKKGGKEIKEAMGEGTKVTVVSFKKGGTGGIMGGIGL